MIWSCSRGQVASAGGSGGDVHGTGCCGRPLAAAADLTVALWGSSVVSAVEGSAGMQTVRVQRPERAGVSAEGRDSSVRARAKRALWARPEHARELLDKMPERAIGLG